MSLKTSALCMILAVCVNLATTATWAQNNLDITNNGGSPLSSFTIPLSATGWLRNFNYTGSNSTIAAHDYYDTTCPHTPDRKCQYAYNYATEIGQRLYCGYKSFLVDYTIPGVGMTVPVCKRDPFYWPGVNQYCAPGTQSTMLKYYITPLVLLGAECQSSNPVFPFPYNLITGLTCCHYSSATAGSPFDLDTTTTLTALVNSEPY